MARPRRNSASRTALSDGTPVPEEAALERTRRTASRRGARSRNRRALVQEEEEEERGETEEEPEEAGKGTDDNETEEEPSTNDSLEIEEEEQEAEEDPEEDKAEAEDDDNEREDESTDAETDVKIDTEEEDLDLEWASDADMSEDGAESDLGSAEDREGSKKRPASAALYSESEEDEEESADELDYEQAAARRPQKLTARQRSLLGHSASQESLVSLPYEDPLVNKEVEQLRRSEKARRRKHQRESQLEATKQATLSKLLKKQSSRRRRAASIDNALRKNTPSASTDPKSPRTTASRDHSLRSAPDTARAKDPPPSYIRYVSRRDGNYLIFPAGQDPQAAGVF